MRMGMRSALGLIVLSAAGAGVFAQEILEVQAV